MKTLDLKTGGHPLKNDDFMLMQSAYSEIATAIMSCLTTDTNVIMSGAVISSVGSTISCSEGYGFYQGEIFKIEASSFSFVSGQNLFFQLVTTVLPPSPEEYKDASLQNVHINRTLKLKYFVAGDIGEYYSSFTRISSLGFKRGMWFYYSGNVSLNFDATGLGVNEMAGFAIMNGGTYTISGGVLYTVPDLRGRSPIGSSDVPANGAPAYDPNLGTYVFNTAYGTSKISLTQSNLPNINFTGNATFTGNLSLWSYEHRLQSGNPVRGLSKDPHPINEVQENIPISLTGPISISSGGSATPFGVVHPVLAAIPVIKL